MFFALVYLQHPQPHYRPQDPGWHWGLSTIRRPEWLSGRGRAGTFQEWPAAIWGIRRKTIKLQLGKQNSESVSLLVELARAENPPGSVSRGGRFINEDADRKRLW